MAYNRRRRTLTSGKRAAIAHVEAYRSLRLRLGPVVEDVRAAFFRLPPSHLRHLLTRYRRRHGASAAEYAENTMPRWRSGAVQLSGQTAQRLLDLVPHYLTPACRFRLVERLCAHHFSPAVRHVTIDVEHPSAGLHELQSTLDELGNLPGLKHLPDHVLESVAWLHDADAVTARAILSEVDKRRNESVRAFAKTETARVAALVRRQEHVSGDLRIELATGEVRISLFKARKSTWARIFQ